MEEEVPTRQIILDYYISYVVLNIFNLSFFSIYLFCDPKLVWDFPTLEGLTRFKIKFLSICLPYVFSIQFTCKKLHLTLELESSK